MAVPDRTRLVSDLRALLGERVTTSDAVREHHSRGESYHPPGLPDAVVFPTSNDEVASIVACCRRHRAPVIPYGAGTSLEGHVVALRGGVSVDLSRMNRVLSVNAADMDAVVEAGVTHRQLNHHLRNTGLVFFVDPGADATLGGMAATRASGTTAVRYGTMRETVMALTVVLPDGRQVRTGSRARKSAAGYDLTRLFVGSEGTLGVITELTVRLYPRPEVVATATCAFPSVRHAVDVVIETSQLGVPIARIELLDEVMIEAVNRYARLQCPVAPTLFFEFHASSDSSVREQVEAVQAVANEHGGSGFEWVTTAEDRARLWKARHDAYYAALALRPGAQAWTTDVCVPISALSECILETRRDMAASSLTGALVGHVGDGNFHIILLVDADRADELAEAERLSGRIVGHALRLQGTCTGEHGIGLGKRTYLIREHGAGVDVMRTIKAALDPDGLMNPGKVFE